MSTTTVSFRRVAQRVAHRVTHVENRKLLESLEDLCNYL